MNKYIANGQIYENLDDLLNYAEDRGLYITLQEKSFTGIGTIYHYIFTPKANDLETLMTLLPLFIENKGKKYGLEINITINDEWEVSYKEINGTTVLKSFTNSTVKVAVSQLVVWYKTR